MEENQESIVTNPVDCLQRRHGGPCYSNWPSRAHPECRAAHDDVAAGKAATGREAASAARAEERRMRQQKRLAEDGGRYIGQRQDRVPQTPLQAKAMHDTDVLYAAWADAEDRDLPPVPLP